MSKDIVNELSGIKKELRKLNKTLKKFIKIKNTLPFTFGLTRPLDLIGKNVKYGPPSCTCHMKKDITGYQCERCDQPWRK